MEPRIAGRYGKLARKSDYRTLRFSHYLTSTAPTPSPSIDNIARTLSALKAAPVDIPNIFPMDANDTLGDCTIAAKAHIQTILNAFVGKRVIAPASLVKSDYFRQSGGQDSGLDMMNVMTDWRATKFYGEKLIAFVQVNPKNLAHVRLAIEMFGVVFVGIQCTQAIDSQFAARVPWTPGPLIPDGHAIAVPTYTPELFTCLTWADTQEMTLGFWNECVDEVYAPMGAEALLAGFSPFFNSSQAAADLRLVTN